MFRITNIHFNFFFTLPSRPSSIYQYIGDSFGPFQVFILFMFSILCFSPANPLLHLLLFLVPLAFIIFMT